MLLLNTVTVITQKVVEQGNAMNMWEAIGLLGVFAFAGFLAWINR